MRATFVFAVLACVAPAQESRPSQGLRTVVASKNDEISWSIPRSHRNAVAFVGGSLYCLVRHQERYTPVTSGLLMESADGGLTWTQAARVPETEYFGFGAVAASTDPDLVHVLWDGEDLDGFGCTYHSIYNPASGKWTAKPVMLEQGTGQEDRYLAEDLGIAEDGTLVAVMSAHRKPKPPWQFWGAGIRVKGPKDEKWSDAFLATDRMTGVAPNLQIHGDRAFLSYRSSSPAHGIFMREFDLKKRAWIAGQKRVDKPTQGTQTSNTSSLLIDNDGDLWVVHGAGASGAGHGELRLVYAPDRDLAKAEHLVVDRDPEMRGGNLNPVHFSLARGPGEQVFVFYSKLTEVHRHLYVATFVDGEPVGKPRKIASGLDNAFRTVNGIRNLDFVSTMYALTTGPATEEGGNRVAAWAQRWPAVTYRR